jgi:hypothetical protein
MVFSPLSLFPFESLLKTLRAGLLLRSILIPILDLRPIIQPQNLAGFYPPTGESA